MSLFVEISLDWARDSEGYRPAVDPPPPSSKLHGHILSQYDPERYTRIFPKGGRLVPCPSLEKQRELYAEFAKIDNDTQLLKFVNAHGPLTSAGNDPSKGELVKDVIDAAKSMRRLLESYSGDPELFGATVPTLTRIDTALVFDPVTARPKITATVQSLLQALWFQCAQAIVGGTVVRYCLECGKQFKAGRGRNKGRRRDAKFCSVKHQIAHNNRNRRKEA